MGNSCELRRTFDSYFKALKARAAADLAWKDRQAIDCILFAFGLVLDAVGVRCPTPGGRLRLNGQRTTEDGWGHPDRPKAD